MGFPHLRAPARHGIVFALLSCCLSCAANVGAPVDAKAVVVNGEAMLLGPLTENALFEQFHIFQERYDEYSPNQNTLATIQSVASPIRISVFLGTWCGDSKRHVPPFLKILDVASNADISYTLIGLDRSKTDKQGLAQSNSITRVPTMIFFKNGHEIGRITERPSESIEKDIVDILTQSRSE